MKRSGLNSCVVAILAVCAAVFGLAAGARAADWTDSSFGVDGIASVPLPAATSAAAAGIVDLALAPEGKPVAALAGFSRSGHFGLARLTEAGALDTSFGEGGLARPFEMPWKEVFEPQAQAQSVAVQGDGKLVVAGFLGQGLHQPTSFGAMLVRYQADGSLDPSFGDGGIVAPPRRVIPGGTVFHDVAVEASGRIVAVGARDERGSSQAPAGLVVAYRPDGSVDTTFGRDGRVLFPHSRSFPHYTGLRAVKLLGNGRILVVGYRDDALFLARLEPDGKLDRAFGGGDGIATLFVGHPGCCRSASLAIQGKGRIVVQVNGGALQTIRSFLVRYRANGTLDRSFGHGGVQAPLLPWRLGQAWGLAIQGDGGILTVGRGERTRANPRGFAYGVYRNLPDGRPDRSFGREGLQTLQIGQESLASAALALPDGRVLTGGSFANETGGRYATRLLLARFLGCSGVC